MSYLVKTLLRDEKIRRDVVVTVSKSDFPGIGNFYINCHLAMSSGITVQLLYGHTGSLTDALAMHDDFLSKAKAFFTI